MTYEQQAIHVKYTQYTVRTKINSRQEERKSHYPVSEDDTRRVIPTDFRPETANTLWYKPIKPNY